MKNLMNITDLTVEEIDELIAVAEDIIANPMKYQDACRHKLLATLFFEPSTRTRLSFSIISKTIKPTRQNYAKKAEIPNEIPAFLVLFILKDFYSLHAFLDSRLVQRNEVCVSCRDALCKAFVDVLWQDNRLHLEECTHDCHVVYL